MSLATFTIRTEAARLQEMEINGKPVDASHLAGWSLRQTADEPVPRLTLELFGEGSFEGEGIVEVARTPGDLSAVAAWIRGLDPDTLRVSAANATGLGGNTTQALLGIIADMLEGGVT